MHNTALESAGSVAHVKGLSHIAIVVSDLARSASFYRKVLGLEVFRDHSHDERAPRLFGVVGGATLELVGAKAPFTAKPQNPLGQPGLFGMAFSVTNLDEAVAALHAAGVVKVSTPKTIAGARILYVPDPDGNFFELIEFDNGASSPPKA